MMMKNKILTGISVTMVGLSAWLLAYSIFFETSYLTQQSVTSYFPWRWMAVYTNSTSALELFLISTAISSVILFASLAAVMELFLISTAISSVILFASLAAVMKLRGASNKPKTVTEENPPAIIPEDQEPETESPPATDQWKIDEDPQSVDAMLAELNRSRQRATALEEAIRAEKEHAESVEMKLSDKMESEGYPISVAQETIASPPAVQPEVVVEKKPVQEVPAITDVVLVEKKLSWSERRAAKKAIEKEERRKKRLEEKNQIVSLEPESKEEEDATELASVNQSQTNETVDEPKSALERRLARKNKLVDALQQAAKDQENTVEQQQEPASTTTA